MFILFYFILPFGLILAFRSEKMYIYIYIYIYIKRSDSQLLVEAFNKKKTKLKNLTLRFDVLIRAKLFY